MADDDLDESFVRPFMVTGGRTVGAAGDIPIETMVAARKGPHGLAPDHAAVLRLVDTPLSIAEIAVHIQHPIGVARVLVADLTASGHVEQQDIATSEDAGVVRRLLDGIRSI